MKKIPSYRKRVYLICVGITAVAAMYIALAVLVSRFHHQPVDHLDHFTELFKITIAVILLIRIVPENPDGLSKKKESSESELGDE